MPMSTKTAALVPAAAATITDLSNAAKRAAFERWSGWAFDLADGGTMPAVSEIMAAGLALGLPDAIAALSADAAAIVKARTLEERIAGRQRWHKELLQPHGGSLKTLKAEIKRRREELVELERVRSSVWWDSRLGSLKAQLVELRAATPRIWPPAPKRPKRTKTAAKAGKPRRPSKSRKSEEAELI